MAKTSGVSVNPTFINSANNLKIAARRMNTAKQARMANKNQATTLQYRKAEQDFHNAENLYCSQKGIVEGGNLSQNEAKAQVNSIMQSVMSYYA